MKLLKLIFGLALVAPSIYAMDNPRPHKPLPPVPKAAGKTSATNSQPAAAQPAPVKKEVTLTYEQDNSITETRKSINALMENNASIARHSIALGKAGKSSDFFTITKETAILVKKLALSTKEITNIYLKMDTFKQTNPSKEQKSLARRKIIEVVDSPEFKKTENDLIAIAANESLPAIVKEPLKALATKIAELPGYMIKKYFGEEEEALEAK